MGLMQTFGKACHLPFAVIYACDGCEEQTGDPSANLGWWNKNPSGRGRRLGPRWLVILLRRAKRALHPRVLQILHQREDRGARLRGFKAVGVWSWCGLAVRKRPRGRIVPGYLYLLV